MAKINEFKCKGSHLLNLEDIPGRCIYIPSRHAQHDSRLSYPVERLSPMITASGVDGRRKGDMQRRGKDGEVTGPPG